MRDSCNQHTNHGQSESYRLKKNQMTGLKAGIFNFSIRPRASGKWRAIRSKIASTAMGPSKESSTNDWNQT